MLVCLIEVPSVGRQDRRKAAFERSMEEPSHPMHLSTTVAEVVLLVAMQVIVIVLLQYGLSLDLGPIML